MTNNMYKGNREDQDLYYDGLDSKQYNDTESALDGLGIKQVFCHAANTGTIDISKMMEILKFLLMGLSRSKTSITVKAWELALRVC